MQLAARRGADYLAAMPRRKIIPLRDQDISRERLLWAVGELLAKAGFAALNVQDLCALAEVPSRQLYRHFGGLSGLLAAYGALPGFWPTAAELAGDDVQALKAMAPAELLSEFFRRFRRAMLRRPQTLDILAWEQCQRTDLAKVLELGRERVALEFFELMGQDPPEGVDLPAVVALMAAALHFLLVRSRQARFYGGMELKDEADWNRLEQCMARMLAGILDR